MFKRVNENDTPPGGWRYKVNETGREFSGVNYSKVGMVNMVSDYLRANGLQVPVNLPDLIEDYTCRVIAGDGCEDVDGKDTLISRLQVTWQALKAGTETIGSWFLAGLPKVTQELADSRSEVCTSCVYNVDTSGCKPCQSDALHKLVGKLIGSSRSSKHETLRACDRCGCSLAVKVWVPMEHISRVEPINPLPDWCWINKEKNDGK